MHERLSGGFWLGEYRVEPRTGQVTGPGGVRCVNHRALEVLLRLAASPQSLVTREDLLQSVWQDTASTQGVLSHAVSELRHALDDHADYPHFIQTLPKRGYRLLVDATLEPNKHPFPADVLPAVGASKKTFLAELRNRGVVETGVAYLFSGWLLIQVAATTFKQLSLPPWSVRFVTYLVVVGFPIALTLAWFVRITAKGAVLDLGPNSAPDRKAFGKPYVAILGALGLAAIGVFAYDRYVGLPGESVQTQGSPSVEPIPVDPDSIAVLPFLNINDSSVGQTFAEGLAEDLTNRLATVPRLKVSSRGDAFSLTPNSSSQSVRKRLRVAYYLEGSVRLDGDSLRVVVQLINSATGFHLVSRSFDRKRKDFFAIQDEITSLTVGSLRVALPDETQTAIEAASKNPDLNAYVLYRRGMDAYHKPPTAKTLAEALEEFRGALKVDSSYAAADAGICLTYVSGYKVTKDTTYIDKAEQSCAAALSLNPHLYIVDNALGELYSQTGRYEDAEAAFERALAIDKNAVDSLIGLGKVYSARQRQSDAEQVLRQAIGLQPGNWQPYKELGNLFWYSGRYKEAAEQYRKIIALDARNFFGWDNLAASLMLSGDSGGAVRAEQQAIDIQPTANAYSNLGLDYYYLGKSELAVASLEKAAEREPKDYLSWMNLGDALSVSEQPERAEQVYGRAEQLVEAQLRINSRDPATTYNCAWIKAMLGKFDEAKELIATARKLDDPEDPYLHFMEALILVRRGKLGSGIKELETAIKTGYPLQLIAAEPHLRALRDEPRFRALIREHE